MDGGADVVMEAGKCQFACTSAAANGRACFQNANGIAGTGKSNGRRESVWTTSDDNGIQVFGISSSFEFRVSSFKSES